MRVLYAGAPVAMDSLLAVGLAMDLCICMVLIQKSMVWRGPHKAGTHYRVHGP